MISSKTLAIDSELASIADYVCQENVGSDLAIETAHYVLMDSIGCAILALRFPACTRLLGPIIAGTYLPLGSRVLGTDFFLDPILAAFNIGLLIRWLDYNDTWLAKEWGHPSDNLGAILAVSDYISRKRITEGNAPLLIKDVLQALIKASEIQGILALENSFNDLGYDHVILVKIASTAIATFLLGGHRQQIMDAVSQAFVDGATLRVYRHAPNTGPRKSWAAGDATSRAVKLAWLTLQGEKGYATVLSAKKWGFYDAVLKHPLHIPRPFSSYVMENILFKVRFPAEFHAQTAVECAIQLHEKIKNKLDQIKEIRITTQESAHRIICKSGPLHNPADRDHCLQYMVAVALLYGDLRADYYEDDFARQDPRIDQLREKMVVSEEKKFSVDYLDPDKRSISNAIEIYFKDGTHTDKIQIDYPIGHRARRKESIPELYQKFGNNISEHYQQDQKQEILHLFENHQMLANMPVNELMDRLIPR